MSSWDGGYLIRVPIFDVESKSAKIGNSLNSLCLECGGGGGVYLTFDPTFDTKIPNSLYDRGGGGVT